MPSKRRTATVNGVTIYYRDIGPRAEPVILLHGFPETGDTFAPAVAALGKRYRLIVPDLRGAGLSQRPPSGYEKKTLATDVKELMDQLKIDRAHVIGHDIGARVAYAFAVQYPERLLSLTVAEAFIEGLAGTAEFKRFAPTNPRTQHFARFAEVDEAVAEYQGKEEELMLSFMNSRSKAAGSSADDVTRYTASLKREGGLRAAFMNYEAFDRDAAFAANADDVQAVENTGARHRLPEPGRQHAATPARCRRAEEPERGDPGGVRPLDLRGEPRRDAAGDHRLSGALKAAPRPR